MPYPAQFREIDTTRQTPGNQVELNDTYVGGLPSKTKNVLLIAPSSIETPTTGLIRAVGSVEAVATAVGVVAARMVDIMIRRHPGISLDLYHIAPAGGAAAAVGAVTFATNAAAGGTMDVYVGTHHTPVTLVEGMTPAEIATALVSAFNAGALPPATAAVDGENTAKVNFTYDAKGTLGNDVRIGVVLPPDVLTTATVTPFAGGAGDGTIDPDVYKSYNYHVVILPWVIEDAQLAAVIAGEDYMIAAQRGRGALHILPLQDTYANALTAAAGVNRFDFQFLHRQPGVHLLPPHEAGALVAAIIASEADPAASFIDEPLPEDFLVAELLADAPLTETEIEACIRGGVTPCRVNAVTLDVDIPIMISTATTTRRGAATFNLASISKFFGLRYTRDTILAYLNRYFPTRASRKMIDGMPKILFGVVLQALHDLADPDQAVLSKAYLDAHKGECESIVDPANPEFVSMSALAPVLPSVRGANVALYLTTPGT